MELTEIFKLQQSLTNQGLSDLALSQLPESAFTGVADEITSENGNVVFRFGGYEYKLWYFSILSANSISDILDAMIRAKNAYEMRKGKK